MSYSLVFSRRAARYFERLDRATQRRMLDGLDAITPNSNPGKRLHGATTQRALRVGGWRIIFRLDDERSTLYVDTIGPRGEVYRDL